jgi:molecular chaperone HscB
MAPDFLMQQLEWREALDEARASGDQAAVDRLRATLAEVRTTMTNDVARSLDEDGDAATASARVRQWMFVERFAEDVDAARRGESAPAH